MVRRGELKGRAEEEGKSAESDRSITENGRDGMASWTVRVLEGERRVGLFSERSNAWD